jgi:ferredoxin
VKNLIVCFSGTGNTYYVAQQIAKSQEDCKIEMVNNIDRDNFETPERLGILFPIHVSIEPYVIDNFINEVLKNANDIHNLEYVYAISTSSSNQSFHGTKRVEKALKNIGVTLTYANHVQMPSNFKPRSSEEKNKKLIEKSNLKIAKIVEELKDEKFKFPRWKPRFIGFMYYLIYNTMVKHYAEDFKVSDDCISCTLCYKGCPNNNITMVNKKPQFANQCLACGACLNNCPTNAIYRKKEKERQYKNPVLNRVYEYRG